MNQSSVYQFFLYLIHQDVCGGAQQTAVRHYRRSAAGKHPAADNKLTTPRHPLAPYITPSASYARTYFRVSESPYKLQGHFNMTMTMSDMLRENVPDIASCAARLHFHFPFVVINNDFAIYHAC